MTVTPETSAAAAEDLLRAFHSRTPGRQSAVVEARPTPDGATGHQVLAECVAGARCVLDLGCADGALLELLAAQGAEVPAGVDLSVGELEPARRRPASARCRGGRSPSTWAGARPRPGRLSRRRTTT
ncbi:hypothetical protein GCM10010441_19410 [Kitasatospora paracochleata]